MASVLVYVDFKGGFYIRPSNHDLPSQMVGECLFLQAQLSTTSSQLAEANQGRTEAVAKVAKLEADLASRPLHPASGASPTANPDTPIHPCGEIAVA